MLLRRQLQRPLLRSVAAAWRQPAPTTTVLLHGSRQLRNEDSEPPPPPPPPPPPSSPEEPPSKAASTPEPSDSHNDTEPPSPAAPTPERSDGDNDPEPLPSLPKLPSLFEQLFPEEFKRAARSSQPNAPTKPEGHWASQLRFDEPPTLTVAEGVPAELDGDEGAEGAWLARAKGMLVLSGASKHLLESDFLRVGIKGQHVEGWVNGIVKVIQSRDRDTLAPLGHYHILFDSPEAAIAYKDAAERAWELGKTYIPGAHHRKDSERRQPVPPGLRTPDGEDVRAALRAFTLFPPSQRYRLEPDDARALSGGGAAFVDRLVEVAGSRHLVLLSLDAGGRISVEMLRQAIEEDGADRNLPWRVLGLHKGNGKGNGGGGRRGNGKGGILPFGRSIVKKETRDAEKALADQAAKQVKENAEDAWKIIGGGGGGDGGGGDGEHRRYPRFIVPFADGAEAQRFVMGWHRRELTLRMGQKGSDQTWDETRIVNAEVLW
ncbi:hypothetical protein F5B20DRAFT_585779 [Whalleya microplaca]|nr:hypothetical protein F5B20DRAFT_585779 [Whalleya microplaca]